MMTLWQWLRSPGVRNVLSFLVLSVWSCEQASSDSSSSSSSSSSQAPRDGIGQRLGTDVTAQPGLAREPAREDLPKIVAFGNSLTAGAGIPADESYPSQ